MEVHVENDAGVEEAGATGTVAFMESHWANLLQSCAAEEGCILCDQDDHLYKLFRSNFALLDVCTLPEDCIQGDRWRTVLLGLETRIQDYNMMTLLRRYGHLSYDDPLQELKVVPRAAFYLVEVARNKEGIHHALDKRLVERQVELGLGALIASCEDQDAAALYQALASLSGLNKGRIPRKTAVKLGAGSILHGAYESFKGEAGKAALVKLWKQWEYGFDLEGSDPATHFGEMRCGTVKALNRMCGNRRLSPQCGGRSSKRVCEAKVDLKQFPLLPTKRKLLLASGCCAREDIREDSACALIMLEEKTLLQSLRVLVLTYEELQSIPFASLCGNLKLDDVIEQRVQELLQDSVDTLPQLSNFINSINVRSEPNTEDERRAKDFRKGLSLAPLDTYQTVGARAEDAEEVERTMIAGVEDICKKRRETSRNECFLTFFQELRKGEAKSVLDAAQEEAYIAETDNAQECLKQLEANERESLSNTLTPTTMNDMRNDGFVVIDDFLDSKLLREARDDMEALSGKLEFNAQSLKGLRRRDDVVTHVSAAKLIDLGFVNLAKVLQKLRAVPALLEEVAGDRLYVPKEVMFACYKGSGARHQSHRDNYPMKGDDGDNGRVLTALLYMNPKWSADMGGELRLQLNVPLDRSIDMKQFDTCDNVESKGDLTDSGEHLDVEPYGGRLVIFKSREIVHSVRPLASTAGNRMALTLWVTDKVQEASFAFTKLTF